ncbi:MAG: PEGA domain-containing protein [Cryomorphaceae bacterium]|nr:PEGA domain-containing protein [Cryomorphaceae bacterium]
MKEICILFFSLFTFAVSAQLKEFHITERDADGTSVVQASTTYPDNAMVLVYSNLPNLDFRSSVGGINQQRYNQRANRYEILVSSQRQILFVAASGFIEQRIALINPNPKDVFHYMVEERKGQDELSVFFTVEPKDAKLFVDNIPTEINQTVSVPLGMVNIRLEREGYRSIDESLLISSEQVNYVYNMRQVTLEPVRIRANVDRARVEIDDNEKGSTDASGGFDLFLFPGIYTIRMSRRNYLPKIQTVYVEEDGDNLFRFDLEKNVGYINLDLEPRDANVFINREKLELNDKIVERPPGTYVIEVRKEGFSSFAKTVELERDQRESIQVELVPQLGALLFRCSPSDAAVVMRNSQGDIYMRWRGIRAHREVPVGTYVLEISAPQYRGMRKSVTISEGETAEVDVSLVNLNPMKSFDDPELAKSEASSHRAKNSMLMATFLPRIGHSGLSLTNSSFGLHYNYVGESWGGYFELASSFNSAGNTWMGDIKYPEDFNNMNISGTFLPEVSIQSFEVGFGAAYRSGYFTFLGGLSYFSYQYFQQMDIGGLENPWVLVSDRTFRGVIPKAGISVQIQGLALGYSLGIYPPNNFGSVFMLGFCF